MHQATAVVNTEVGILKSGDITYLGHGFYRYQQKSLFGLHHDRRNDLRLAPMFVSLELFPGTTHLWAEDKSGQCGVFDIEIGEMIVPVNYSHVFHTQIAHLFTVWDDDKKLGTFNTILGCLSSKIN